MKSQEIKDYLAILQPLLKEAGDEQSIRDAVVNVPFHNRPTAFRMGLGIVVLLLVNKKTKTINRIALSNTDFAQHALDMSQKKFHQIKIPLNDKKNIIPLAIKTRTPQHTTDWKYLFTPDMSGQAARFNQSAAGIECSFVYPLTARDGGALIFSYFLPIVHIQDNQSFFMKNYAEMVSKKLTREPIAGTLLQD